MQFYSVNISSALRFTIVSTAQNVITGVFFFAIRLRQGFMKYENFTLTPASMAIVGSTRGDVSQLDLSTETTSRDLTLFLTVCIFSHRPSPVANKVFCSKWNTPVATIKSWHFTVSDFAKLDLCTGAILSAAILFAGFAQRYSRQATISTMREKWFA